MNQQANQKLSTYLCCIGREREAKEYLVSAVLYGRLFKARDLDMARAVEILSGPTLTV